MSDLSHTLKWPAILVLNGDDELLYFEDYLAWSSDEQIQDMVLAHDDKLIDATGRIYHLVDSTLKSEQVAIGHERICLKQLADLIRAHEAQKGSCCAAKMAILNLQQGFAVVKQSQ